MRWTTFVNLYTWLRERLSGEKLQRLGATEEHTSFAGGEKVLSSQSQLQGTAHMFCLVWKE